MQPEDITRLASPGDPRLDPSGERVSFTVSRPNIEDDRYDRTIWLADSEGARPFTAGPRDSSARWSPDGSHLAFFRSPEDGKPPQVAVMPVAGGEPHLVSDFRHGVEALEWSPDGTKLAVTAVTSSQDWEDVDDDERKRRPKRVRSIPYRHDLVGWMDDRRRHIWLLDPEGTEEAKCLTPGDSDDVLHDWSPDGSKIVFVADRDPDRGMVAGNDVFEVSVETGAIAQVSPRGLWWSAGYRPDGVLHLIGKTPADYATVFSLYRREADGSLTLLADHLDRSVLPFPGSAPFIRWEGDRAIVGLEDSGSAGLVSIAPDGSVTTLVEGNRAVTGADSANGRVVFTASTWDNPGELFSVGEENPKTGLNTQDLGLIEPVHFRAGPSQVDTWVVMPPGDGPVPLLLNIHGGPASQYGFGFFDEFQVYASAGFGVVACNPRGSSGRGMEFVKAVTGDGWGVVDLEDINTAVDEAMARNPRLDSERMGIMGGSYGGFMTAWTTAFEDRWKSAVVERALTNFASFAGTSDIGAAFPFMYTGADYPDAWETWWKRSPMAYVHQVTTPTLVIHSENDFRCPIEQGEQFFTALLRNGTPTEMVRFPGESHELSRSGKPRHRKERFEAILDWHDRHLK